MEYSTTTLPRNHQTRKEHIERRGFHIPEVRAKENINNIATFYNEHCFFQRSLIMKTGEKM